MSLQEIMLLKDALFPSLMCTAARKNNLSAVQQLVNAVSFNGNETFFNAVFFLKYHSFRFNSFQGADVKAGDFDGRTPLHVAVCEGHEAMTELLIKSGALIHAKDRYDFNERKPGIRSSEIQPLQIQFKSSIFENDTKD